MLRFSDMRFGYNRLSEAGQCGGNSSASWRWIHSLSKRYRAMWSEDASGKNGRRGGYAWISVLGSRPVRVNDQKCQWRSISSMATIASRKVGTGRPVKYEVHS